MSNPTGLTINYIVLDVDNDGRQFLRFDADDADCTSLYAYDLADVSNWLASNYISPDCEVHDLREPEESDDYEPDDDSSWADGDALASAGWGTDEDYGAY